MILLNSIYKKYGDKEVLKNVDLTINSDEVTFIVGTSGAGKSTLLNLIGGLDRPTSGKVIFNGHNIEDDLNLYRAKNIAFVFQDFNLISGLSVTQNVEIATSFSGTKKTTESIRHEIMALGISDPDQKVETLSGGEKQRAAVIRSICKDADVIIADEPTGNLDSSNADLVLDLLRSLKTGKHIIIVSHDMEKARKYADRIITLRDGNIISDEKQKKAQETIVKSKSDILKDKSDYKPLTFGVFITLGKNSVILRKGKILSIAMVIALAIASLAIVINLNQVGSELSHHMNVNYLENDLINLYYSYTPNTGFMETPLTPDEIQWIQNNYDIQENVQIYLNESNDWLFSVADKAANVYLKQININGFFNDRIMSNEIEGRFLRNKNEIIIAQDVAQKLFDGNCIGKEVSLNDGMGNSVRMTIVGINHTVNPFDKIYSFVSTETIKEILSDKMKATIFQRQELFTYYTEIQSMTTGGLYGSMKALDTTEKLLYGKMPNSSDQIMISSELLINVLSDLGVEKDYTKEHVVTGKIQLNDINKMFTKKLALNFNGLFELYISGIYMSNDIEMRFTNELIQEMQNVNPIAVDIYVSNPDEVTAIKDSINAKMAFEANAQLETLKENVSMQTRFFSIALIMLGIVLLLISIALLNSFSKIAVLERKKEVAIIKSLGANNRNVLSILLFDSAVITLLSFVLAMLIFPVFQFVLPYILPDTNIINFGFPLLLITMISLVFTLLVFILTGLNLKKLVKKMPAELFAQ